MRLYQDMMNYFNKQIPIHGCNLSILWPPLKNRTPKNPLNAKVSLSSKGASDTFTLQHIFASSHTQNSLLQVLNIILLA